MRRNGFLYDKTDHTDEFDGDIDLDIVRLYEFEDLPVPFKRFIIYKASRIAATQLVANPGLVRLLGVQEQQARAALQEYECNQGDHSMMGFQKALHIKHINHLETLDDNGRRNTNHSTIFSRHIRTA